MEFYIDRKQKNLKSTNNNEVIETLMGVKQQEKIKTLPPTLINNKGGRKRRKKMKGNKEIAAEKAKKDGRKCHKCGKYIKYRTSVKHDARNCHKFATEEARSNV
uniref:Uncharacterized protein n=1 Tax=Lactuca sativa TaxID=4236 RepID=A0A9R1VWH8_LACSA|nr:hypothetical protein LSAT_V11C400184640 [Lactuca sativa]